MSLKIYTKTGDKGKTSLLGGKKVSKSDHQIVAYGNVDELNAFLGYLKGHEEVNDEIDKQLHWVQEQLFSIGSILSTAPNFNAFDLPELSETEISQLEIWIDKFDDELPKLKNFILPIGHRVVSLCHVCRTICRRTERSVSVLAERELLEEHILPFLNRLSDYLFVLARKLAKDLDVLETPWNPTH